MNRTILALCVLASFSTRDPLLALQDGPAVSLSEALRLFGENSLELRMARSRAADATGRARQASAFPNPSFEVTHEALSGEDRGYSESYLNVSQRFELPGQRDARTVVADDYRLSALHTLRADSIRLAFEVKQAFLRAALAGERIGVIERVTGVFREAASAAEERYEEGEISRYDLKRIDAELARYENLRGDAEIDVASTRQILAGLVAPEGAARRLAPDGMPAGLPPAADRMGNLDSAQQRRAELDAARAEVAAAEAEVRLARSERTPDLTATGGYKRQSDGRTGAFMGVSLPFPLFDRKAGAVESADARARMAAARLALTRRAMENDIFLAADTYRSLRQRFETLTDRASDEGDDLLSVARVAYEAGEMELVELMDAAEAFEQAENAAARLQSRLWIAYYDLERALGGFGDGGPSPASDPERDR